MSLLAIAGILILSIILLIVTFMFATDALWQLGISNLFKSIEEVFEGKNKGDTATDYIIYAMIISGFLLAIFIILIVVGIILLIVGAGTGVDEVAAAGGGAVAAEGAVDAAGVEAAAAEEGGSSFLSGFGNLLSGWVGTILTIVLVIVVFASSASGALCFLAAAEIRKEPKYNGNTKLKNAYEDTIIAGISGIAVVVFSIMGIIGYYSYKYYKKKQIQKLEEQQKQDIGTALEFLAENNKKTDKPQ